MPLPQSIRARLVLGVALATVPVPCAMAADGNDAAAGLRGIVRSKSRLEISSSLTLPVAEVPVRPGLQFAKGELLLSFDCTKLLAEARAAEASARAADVEHRQKAQLRKYGAAGQGEVDLAAAGAARGKAEVELAAARTAECEIRAPFDGRVVEINAHAHEYPQSGKPLLVILDDRNLEIDLVAPSRWLGWLKQGEGFSFAIDETGKSHVARLSAIGAEVDAISQTVRLTGSFQNNDGSVLAGMSGTANFDAAAPTSAIRTIEPGAEPRQ